MLFRSRVERLQRDTTARERLAAVDQRMSLLRQEEVLLSGRLKESRGLSGLDETGLADLSFQLGRLRERRRYLAQLEEEVARNREAAELIPRAMPSSHLPLSRGVRTGLVVGMLLLAALSLILWAGGLVSSSMFSPMQSFLHARLPAVTPVLFPLIGLLFLLLAVGIAWPLFSTRPALNRDNLELLENKRQEAGREILGIEARVQDVFARAGLPDTGSEHERFEQLRIALAQFQSDSARMAENGMRQEALASEQSTLLHMRSALRSGEEALDEEMPGSLSGDVSLPQPSDMALVREAAVHARSRLPGLQEELDAVSEALAAARMRCATLEARLERVPQEDRLQQLLEEQSRLTSQKASLETYGEALGIALEELRASALQLQQGVSPLLDTHAGEVLQKITGGRYSQVGTDDRLSVHVEVSGTAQHPAVSLLSAGTTAAAWLAIRLAAVRMLEQGRETLPLFLDEPFAHYDEERTAAALRWLRDSAGERQIFMFACRERDRNLVKEIFADRGYLEHLL